jgi:hypothetical protein
MAFGPRTVLKDKRSSQLHASIMPKVLHANPIENNPYPSNHSPGKNNQRTIIPTHPQRLVTLNNLPQLAHPNQSKGILQIHSRSPIESVPNSIPKLHKPHPSQE